MTWESEKLRHSLTRQGIKTKIPVIQSTKKTTLPPTLYHGTTLQNAENIIKEGLKARTPTESWEYGKVTKEMGHQADTYYNVSLARKEKDAIFFAVSQFEFSTRPQAIIIVDTSKLNPNNMLARDLFRTPNGEIKHIGSIPPEAIMGVHVRVFDKSNDDFKVHDYYFEPNQVGDMVWDSIKRSE